MLALGGNLSYSNAMETHSFESGVNSLPRRQEHIAVDPDICGGKPRVAGHRVKVQHVAIWHERQGKSPDEIVAEHPELTLADVHAALAYYYDYRQQIDTDIRTDEDFAAGLKAASPPSLLARRFV
jgi:uncharacterized protein (DUF433 family)